MSYESHNYQLNRDKSLQTKTTEEPKAVYDPINPPHYKNLKPEPIEIVDAWKLDYYLGSVIKYLSRAGHKTNVEELEDLRKARWYLDRKIKNLEKQAF